MINRVGVLLESWCYVLMKEIERQNERKLKEKRQKPARIVNSQLKINVLECTDNTHDPGPFTL